MNPLIAIIIPAYNEELTIARTLRDFHGVCPDASFYVVDNASTDATFERTLSVYQELGCQGWIIQEPRKGKAIAMRRAFLEINADIYVMVDADLTYPAKDLPQLLQPVLKGNADMVCGDRHSSGAYRRENKRPMHVIGNHAVRIVINFFFKGNLQDIFTGYRVMSKRFVKNSPILSDGFELETELSIHALDKGYSVIELPTDYRDRPEGSFSKLSTFTDGMLVMKTIFSIFVNYRPLVFFTFCSVVLAISSLAIGSIPIMEFIRTSRILHIPLAILATGLSILSMLSFSCAVILDGIAKSQRFNHALQLLHWSDRQGIRTPTDS